MSAEPRWTVERNRIGDAQLWYGDEFFPPELMEDCIVVSEVGAYAALAADVAAARRLDAIRNDAVWMAKLARGSSWPGEMAESVERAANRVIAALTEGETP